MAGSDVQAITHTLGEGPSTVQPDISLDPFYERDLEQMSRATNYLEWQFSLLRPFVAGEVLEVGAGIGTFTTRLAANAAHVTALEPNRHCFGRLTAATGHLANVTRHELTVEAFHGGPARGRTFHTIVCMNVLEHIQDDAAVVREFRSLVSPGGRVVLLVPAMPVAFGEIDRRLGHYRRYTRSGLRNLLRATGWNTTLLRYFNTIGLLGWLWNTRVSVKSAQSDGQIQFFDRLLVPLLSRVEALIPPPYGQSLLAVGTAGE